jgi:CubicO group peptidase (beta-lactamase class C family)
MKRLSLPLALLGLALPLTAGAQTGSVLPRVARAEDEGFSSARLARIDSLIQPMVTRGEIPGAVVLLMRHGRVVFHRAYGYRDIGTRAPLLGNDIFRIASQSKAITSLAVMMLWEEGRFGLDDPIERYIPEFAKPTVLTKFHPSDTTWTAEPARRSITIRQLLTHTSGIDYAGIGSDEFKAIYAKAGIPSGIGNDRFTIGEKMRRLATLPLKHQPGERFTYSLSLDVLGYFVEVISGMPFDRFLRTRIFDPLGMKDTWFYLPSDRAARLVTLHEGDSGKVIPRRGRVFDDVNPDYPRLPGTYFSGGAGLSGTVEDYARFLQLFLNGGTLDGVRVLSPRTVAMMLTDQLPTLPNEYGLGFGLETVANDHQSPRGTGSFSWGGAFSTSYWADPKEQLIGILYTNTFSVPAAGVLGSRFPTLVYAALVQ